MAWEPDLERVIRALGVEPAGWHEAAGHGVVRLPSDRSADHLVFVKIAAFDDTAEWLRAEHAACEALDGLAFLPRLVGWDDDGEHPVLAIESFADAVWPPPWTPEGVDAVRAALEEVRRRHRSKGIRSCTWSSSSPDGSPASKPRVALGPRTCSRTVHPGSPPSSPATSSRGLPWSPSHGHHMCASSNSRRLGRRCPGRPGSWNLSPPT